MKYMNSDHACTANGFLALLALATDLCLVVRHQSLNLLQVGDLQLAHTADCIQGA
jgi:hypothetical protein